MEVWCALYLTIRQVCRYFWRKLARKLDFGSKCHSVMIEAGTECSLLPPCPPPLERYLDSMTLERRLLMVDQQQLEVSPFKREAMLENLCWRGKLNAPVDTGPQT
eukprot:873459-Pelagomonas_calceolata.AAC.2